MPIVDTRIKCLWCDTEQWTFLCPCCDKRTCRECSVYYDEEGNCRHEATKPVESKTWDIEPEDVPGGEHRWDYKLP